MNKSLQHIQQKSGSIQYGLLRFRDKQGELTLQAKATPADNGSINCIVTESSGNKKLENRNVSLVQKRHDDYLYITGKVSSEVINGSKILSIRILKACWFVKKSRGSVSWLKEKYLYERSKENELAATA